MKKTLILATLSLLIPFMATAATVSFQSETFSGTVTYNEKGKPGEAIFARLNMKINKSVKKKTSVEPQAVLQLIKEDKKIEHAQFYFLNAKSKRLLVPEMLAGVPLSMWLEPDESYSVKIILSSGNTEETAKEIILPFTLESVEFFKETIPLDSRNSGIRQDMGPERLAQIEKLNNILGTINTQDIFTQKPFEMPVLSNRYTAHYGDRRIYQYTNGKSATSPHYGNDYGVPEGTEVSACQEGKVVLAEFRISTGWSVVIEHLPGLYSLYYHMSSLNVAENDYVKAGDKIGLSGMTGLATGPHLHWEVRLNMCAVRPEYFMTDYTLQNHKE